MVSVEAHVPVYGSAYSSASHCVSIKKNCLVLFKEMTGVCYENCTVKSKSKAILLQAWTGLRVPGG
jgi:hypothetical protein